MGGLAHLRDNGTGNTMHCDPPYNHSYVSKFCPCKYCELIKSLVDMDIQMVQRAYWGGAGHEHQFFPGDSYYEMGKQIVKDINYTYDCAGKRRPIIQGAGFDTADPSNFRHAREYDNDTNNPIHIDRNIPVWIIDLYFQEFNKDIDEIDPHFPTSNPEPSGSPLLGCYREDDPMKHDDDYEKSFRNYYFNSNGTTKNCLFFRRERICGNANSEKVDIQYVEARMWLLYEACVQIDMGYTSLHMGVYWDYTKSERGSYDRLYQLTNAIRAYAKKVPGRFVLLSGEPPMQDVDSGETAKHTNHFIFDFDSRAMRPREISDIPSILGDGPQVSGDGGAHPPGICDDPIDPGVLEDFFLHSPCANTLFPAVIDPCTINSFGGTTSGIHPLSGCHMDVLPYTVHFDGFSAPVNPGVASDGNSSLTWGYHDHQWFTMLNPACQRWWFDYFYCKRRNYHDGNGFVVIPGILFFDSDLTSSAGGAGMSLISDNSAFVDNIKNNTLAPTVALPTIEINEKWLPNGCDSTCDGVAASVGKMWLTGTRCYTIQVGNKDCSSMYSIHIQGPEGEWYPLVLGDTRKFCPTVSGSYKIGIRQDNLGLPAATFGTQENWITRYLDPNGCIEQISNCPNRLGQIAGRILLFPNPTSELIHVEYWSNEDEKVDLIVLNSINQVQYSVSFKASEGKNLWNVEVGNLPAGGYVISVSSEKFFGCKKFIKTD